MLKGGAFMTSKECGEFIVFLRKEKNLTQKQLAEKINVTDKAVSRWETGKGYPDVVSLTALSEFFNISVNELLAGKKISVDSVKEEADKNIITVIKDSKKIRFKCVITVLLTYILLCFVCFLLGLFLMKPGAEPITAVISCLIVCVLLSFAGIFLARYQSRRVLVSFCATFVSALLLVPSLYFIIGNLLSHFTHSVLTEIMSLIVMLFGIPGFLFIGVLDENLNSNPIVVYVIAAVFCVVIPAVITWVCHSKKE